MVKNPFRLFLLLVVCLGFCELVADTGSGVAILNLQQSQDSQQGNNTARPKSDNRMEDHGCCVLKKSEYKPEWDYSDNEVRKLCIETARKAGIDYDFYKNQKCDRIKKQSN